MSQLNFEIPFAPMTLWGSNHFTPEPYSFIDWPTELMPLSQVPTRSNTPVQEESSTFIVKRLVMQKPFDEKFKRKIVQEPYECPICYEEKQDDIYMTNHCIHAYCKDCLERMESHHECPLCRELWISKRELLSHVRFPI